MKKTHLYFISAIFIYVLTLSAVNAQDTLCILHSDESESLYPLNTIDSIKFHKTAGDNSPDEVYEKSLNGAVDLLYEYANSWTFEGRYAYNQWPGLGTFSGKNYCNTTVISGEGVCSRAVAAVTHGMVGNYTELCEFNSFSNPEFSYVWTLSWEGIYLSNTLINKIESGQFAKEGITQDEFDQITGTAYAMRAYYYLALISRWGEVPYKTSMLTPEDINVAQSPFDSIVNWMVQDCDKAAQLLPEVSYSTISVKQGKIGKASALALKSKVLTLAASPLNNPLNNLEKWKRAAEAAWDVIAMSNNNSEKLALYELDTTDITPTVSQGKYNNIFWGLPTTVEDLWPRNFEKVGPMDSYRLIWLPMDRGGYMPCSPTMEYVDAYEDEYGYPIQHLSSVYSDETPFTGRDPRFEFNLLHHGSVWDNNLIDMRTSPILGADRTSPNAGYGKSETGYLVKKVVPESWSKNAVMTKEYVNAPYIRMAEMYLNYAEACNEAYGPQGTVGNSSLTAVEALNALRSRVGHVDVPSEFTATTDLFRERVRNEFKVELMFEYHAWYDMMRWKTAQEELDGAKFHGMLVISKPDGSSRYERFELDEIRIFLPRQYRYPFFQSVIEKCPNITQNPGW